MADESQDAPGAPGIGPRWTSSAKSGVGTALNRASRVWFTISHGILDEVYFGKVDRACTRDLGLIVTAADQFFSEEKRQSNSVVSYLAEGVPAYKVINTCREGRYQIEKRIISDPHRDVVLQHTKFTALQGKLSDYKLFALLAPHIANQGADNTGWTGEYKGWPMLYAQRAGISLALGCSTPWVKTSAGYVGRSDGWQDLHQHYEMQWTYRKATSGNVALTGEIDLAACDGEFVLALGFGDTGHEAGLAVSASLNNGFERARAEYFRHWQEWQAELHPMESQKTDQNDLYRISAAVIRIHESKGLMGGIIASLAIPWGASKGDDDLGGYHLVWPRDLVESASALLAAGAPGDLHRILGYLRVTQEADGHWPQNMWLDSRMYWTGVQMDETALVLLLVDLGRRKGILEDRDLRALWPMIRKAAQFVVCNGPVSQEDRWEEDAGYTPFTLAAEIAGLLAAAEIADFMREQAIAQFLRETADAWNSSIERWIYVADSQLARQHGLDGYYIRLRPPGVEGADMRPQVGIPNHADDFHIPADKLISPDALALVRFGLRAADDPRIVDTVKIIDALLKVETPHGTTWHRYNDDGYGEHADGAPFDGAGIGRAWPLLAGERAHYELALGDVEAAEELRHAMEGFASDGGLIPEQVWDSSDVPERELYFGRPSGSAMPLVWAHAEYIKLRRSLVEGKIWDQPPQTVQRYIEEKVESPFAIWRFGHKARTQPQGTRLRIELRGPARVHWTRDEWKKVDEIETHDTSLGMHLVDLPTDGLNSREKVQFTFFWTTADRWEGTNFAVTVE